MNLLVKRLGQLAVLAVALIFFSCEDETSLGFKNPQPKFDINYVEIPLETSVFLLDSLKTGNFRFPGESSRFLVGQYTDPELGKISASTFTQFYPAAKTLPDDATYDSVALELAYDYYNYGSRSVTSQQIGIYRVVEDFDFKQIRKYVNSSVLETNAEPLATHTFTINPSVLDKALEDNVTPGDSIHISLPSTFGRSIFDFVVQKKSSADSVFFPEFAETFKGLRLSSEAGDKVLGFSITSPVSRIIIYYHTTSTDSLQYNLRFNTGAMSFNNIQADHSGTEIESLIPLVDADLSKRYIQSGGGVVTKLDLGNVLKFFDTVSNVIINEAQLIITDVESPANTPPPSALALRILEEDNRVLKWNFKSTLEEAYLNYIFYSGTIERDMTSASGTGAFFENDLGLYIRNDVSAPSVLQYSKSESQYRGFLTTFFQQLLKKDARKQYTSTALYPFTPSAAKSVNRLSFSKESIKARIYYTKPLITP